MVVQWLGVRLSLLWIPGVQSLVEELGSRKLYSVAKNLKKKKIFKIERYQKNDAIEVQKKPEGLEGLSGGNRVFNR